MTEFDWKTFLQELSRVALAVDKETDPAFRLFSPDVHASGYLGVAGATNILIAGAEIRLGVQLPPSYKSFLRVSNGWPMLSSSTTPGRLWRVEEIYWLRDHDPYEVKIWGEGLDQAEDMSPEEHLYQREQNTTDYRESYVKNLLSISDHGDACDLLLSPEVVDEQGEWECWHIANWYPGARRYPSFEAWVNDQCEFLAERLSRA